MRASACAKSLGAILQHPTMISAHIPDEVSLQKCVLDIINNLNKLCEDSDEIVNLRAFCVRALAVQGFLTECLEPANKTSPNQFPARFPGPFQPLYKFLSSRGNTSQIQQHDTVALPREDKMWKTVLYDGPLDNLTFLASKILSRGDANRSGLSLCWKTFDKLRSQLRIDRVDVSEPSSTQFDEEHKKARTLIRDEEPDFSVAPLLEVLDAVAGGRRLSRVFLDDSKYHDKDNLVFGKDRLQNPDLFRAFANCLPDFVTKHPEKSMEFMEGLVCYDHLWTSLQVNLLNSLQSNAFIPAKLRVFERCCTVIDAAFALLENSPNVDWRSPELGSLAHYFELFVTDCFQGMFIERAIGFRVGLIKARFCKVVLTQFLDEFNHVGTVVFRSNWDVASLARVFYSLGVGTDEDVEFWKLFVDGGSIGAEFVAKTHTMLETACSRRLITKLLQTRTSWDDGGSFRRIKSTGYGLREAVGFSAKDDGRPTPDTRIYSSLGILGPTTRQSLRSYREEQQKDQENMQDLLTKIDAIYRPNGHVQSQAPETSAIVQPNPPFGGSMSANGITPAPFNNSSSRFPNLYSNPYPLLPNQSGPGGVAAHTVSASLSPTPSPYMRRNEQDRHALVYYPPGGKF
ncbi:hypothetical protein EDB86DRAFT_2924391 [Lactarius hatsudake]|nr:hypothetical protein EDB86DRAFT_2924391 [Lactarius hatsudake]